MRKNLKHEVDINRYVLLLYLKAGGQELQRFQRQRAYEPPQSAREPQARTEVLLPTRCSLHYRQNTGGGTNKMNCEESIRQRA